jgi:hypothetical protein
VTLNGTMVDPALFLEPPPAKKKPAPTAAPAASAPAKAPATR